MDSNQRESQFEIRYRYAGSAYRYATFSKSRVRLLSAFALALLVAFPSLSALNAQKNESDDRLARSNPTVPESHPNTVRDETQSETQDTQMHLSALSLANTQTETKTQNAGTDPAGSETVAEPKQSPKTVDSPDANDKGATLQPNERVSLEEVNLYQSSEGFTLVVHLRNNLDSKAKGKLTATLRPKNSKDLSSETTFSMKHFVAKKLSFASEDLPKMTEPIEVEVKAVDPNGESLISELLTKPVLESETINE